MSNLEERLAALEARVAALENPGFKVGDRVKCSYMGEEGTVSQVSDGVYPIHVHFSSSTQYYTVDGKYAHACPVTLTRI